MTALNVLIYPDDHLKIVCEPVVEVNDDIRKIVDDMFDTMYQEEGIGLAAPQVDILQRIITIDIEGDKQDVYKRQPLSFVASDSVGNSKETAGDKPEEGGDDVKSSWPLRVGLHTCYNGVYRGKR